MNSCFALATITLTIALAAATASAGFTTAPEAPDNIIFPADAGVIDVTKAPYNAKGDAKSDDTAAIQKALNDNAGDERMIYLPNGTYRISDTLRFGGRTAFNSFQGQSSTKTILQLADHCQGYTDPAHPRSMIWTGQRPAQRFCNSIRNMTFDTGRGNPGAIGVQFMASNTGCMRQVIIRSGDADGAGVIGLDLGYTDEQGPCLIKDVMVQGFDTGVSARTNVDSITMEHIRLENQRLCALRNAGQVISIRALSAAGPNATIVNTTPESVMTLIDSTLAGQGAASTAKAAIDNDGVLFVRNLRTSTFARAIDNKSGTSQGAAGPNVDEFVSHPVSTLFASNGRSLNLPIRETPELPWDDLNDWANVRAFKQDGDADDTAAVQRAIDSGKTTVYFPNGKYKIAGTVLVRGNVRRIIGCEAYLEGGPGADAGFKIVDGAAPVVQIERFKGALGRNGCKIIDESSRTFVMKDMCDVRADFTGTGDVYLDDVCVGRWRFKGQNVWARQWNAENQGTKIINDGGTLWILGIKTEKPGTIVETTNGGKTEVLGGFFYPVGNAADAPMFVITDAAMSITAGESAFNRQPYEIVVKETQNGQTKQLPRGQTPARNGGSAIGLFVSGSAAQAARP